jgi:hypothetical protein
MKSGNDWLTIAAIGVLAMCVVTFDHEGLGHGSACLLVHGRITLLSSSIFHCSARSGWIDPAGPAMNLLMGTLALIASRFVPPRLTRLKLFLISVTAFSYFWEAGYVMDAMRTRHGDLYFFAQFLLDDVPLWLRLVAAGCGVALYIVGIRLTSRALLELWSDPAIARRVARTVWLAASIAAALAALAYHGEGWGDFRDAVLEIAACGFPLLFVPVGRGSPPARELIVISRSYPAIAVSSLVFGIFTATLGRGIGF